MGASLDQLSTAVDRRSELFKRNEASLSALVDELRERLERSPAGPRRAQERHLARGKLLPRDRVDTLLDRGSPFLELSPLAADGMYGDEAPGAGLISGVGRVSGRECVVIANDATVKDGTYFPMTVKKHLRAQEVALANGLPCVYLVDSGGAFLPLQDQVFPDREHFGRIFFNQATMSVRGIPQIAAVLGSCTAGGAYVPAMSDEAVIVRDQGTIFLGGPPLVKAATGEVVTDEELGGGLLHARTSEVTDHLADDDRHALAIVRSIVAGIAPRSAPPWEVTASEDPAVDPAEIYGVIPADPRTPYDVREIIARPGVRASSGHRGQQRCPVLRICAQGHPLHRAVRSAPGAAAVPAEHHGFHGRTPIRGGRDRQARSQDGHRGGVRSGPQVDGDRGWFVWRRQLFDVRPSVLAPVLVDVAGKPYIGYGW